MPALPKEIIGHSAEQAQLLADIAKDNVSHAYLLTGPKHLGKFTIAKWFAWRILADQKTPEETDAIKDQIERMIHPDFLCLDQLWIEEIQDDWKIIGQYSNVQQQHRSKAPAAKTDTISIEDVRALQQRLHETGASKRLCCLIRSIDRMQPAAANAFLKVLEEPPPRVAFVLTAESEHSVLPTIASRTRILRFHPVSVADMQPMLAGFDEEEAAFALHLSQGAPGTLRSLLSSPEELRAKRQLHGQAKQFWQARTLHERLQWILPALEKKQDLDELLLHLGLALREHPDVARRQQSQQAYMALIRGLRTNAHRGLLLEQFALAVTES